VGVFGEFLGDGFFVGGVGVSESLSEIDDVVFLDVVFEGVEE
jgi:hypothetical protein